jgi:ribonuclease E
MGGNGHDDEHDGGRRRRRRGRRGGRRNRHRNGDMPMDETSTSDADLQHAAEDMDVTGPAESSPREFEQPRVSTAEAEFAPPPQAAREPEAAPAPAPAPEPAAEPPRRRSTIREAAPIGRSEAPAPTHAPAMPTPEPVVSSTAPEPAEPKRGWWGKRLLGGK